MARFTRIPETNLAGILGGVVGQAAGTVISSTNLAVDKLQGKLDKACEKISNGDKSGYKDLEKVGKTIDTLDKTISKVEKTVQALDKTVSAVKVPITALKIAVNIIKYLPLPQMWLVTSVSALQADIVQMMSELIAQIEQIILTISIVIKIILSLLQKLKELLAKLRKVLAALKASMALTGAEDGESGVGNGSSGGGSSGLSAHDREVLDDLGIFDPDGSCIFDKLASAINKRTTDIIWIGNYKDIDTGSIAVENQVRAAESGTTVDVTVGSVGDWITYAYCKADTKPEKPVSRELVPAGWTSVEEVGKNVWVSKGTVSGASGKVSSWTEPVLHLKMTGKTEPVVPKVKKVNVFRMSAARFKVSSFNMQEANAIILASSDEGYRMMLGLLQNIDEAPVSQELKDKLCVEINPQEDQSEEGMSEDVFVSTSGNIYKLTLKASNTSPKIATQRYVEVTDAAGALVYEGPLTFATDPTVIFEDTKVRLIQLLN